MKRKQFMIGLIRQPLEPIIFQDDSQASLRKVNRKPKREDLNGLAVLPYNAMPLVFDSFPTKPDDGVFIQELKLLLSLLPKMRVERNNRIIKCFHTIHMQNGGNAFVENEVKPWEERMFKCVCPKSRIGHLKQITVLFVEGEICQPHVRCLAGLQLNASGSSV